MTEIKDDFFEVLEQGVRDVLLNKKSTSAQKMQAIAAGSKLLQIKHKVPEEKSKPGNFFSK